MASGGDGLPGVADAAASPGVGEFAGAGASGHTARLVSLGFLALVALLLVLPPLQTLHPVLGELVRPVDEHRSKSPFPSPALLFETTGDFAEGLNRWFDDRLGFRSLLIRTKNQIDYSVFGVSGKVYIGADGWLFAKTGDPIDRISTARLAALEQSFVTLAERLQQKGVRLVVVGYPQKSAIYPEKTPREMKLTPPGGNYDHLRRFLAQQPSLIFVDAGAILADAKRHTAEPVYAKTDVHATQIGQLPVVKEIIARIAAAEGRSDIRWDEKFELEHSPPLREWGAEGRMLSLLFPIEEETPSFKGRYKIGGAEPGGTWTVANADLQRADPGAERPFDWAFESRPELCPQRLPGMVLFGNSFSDFYWVLGLHRYFCFIRRAHNPMDRFEAFYDAMPPGTKYFIFQYWTQHLPDDGPPVE